MSAFTGIGDESLIITPSGAGNVLDQSGNGNHGTLQNGAEVVAGVPGASKMAISLDGVDDYVTFGDVDLLGSFSVSLWVKINVVESGYLFAKHNVNTYGFFLYYQQTDEKVQFYGRWAGADIFNILTDSAISSTDWVHLVATHEPGSQKLYVNGVPQSTTGTGTSTYGNNSGNMNCGKSDHNPVYPQCNIDGLRVYNRVITAAERMWLARYPGIRGAVDYSALGLGGAA